MSSSLVDSPCTVFWKADATYFPWRPDGQRRLLPDGSFGDEGETARIFSKIPEPYSFNKILDGVGDTEQQENDGIVRSWRWLGRAAALAAA